MAIQLNEDQLGQGILRVLNEQIEAEVDKEITEIRDRIEAKVRKVVAGLALQLLNSYELDRQGNTLIIRVQIKD